MLSYQQHYVNLSAGCRHWLVMVTIPGVGLRAEIRELQDICCGIANHHLISTLMFFPVPVAVSSHRSPPDGQWTDAPWWRYENETRLVAMKVQQALMQCSQRAPAHCQPIRVSIEAFKYHAYLILKCPRRCGSWAIGLKSGRYWVRILVPALTQNKLYQHSS